jgi:aminopeptidase YwaD
MWSAHRLLRGRQRMLLASLLVLTTLATPAHGQVAAVAFSGAAAKAQVDALAVQIGSRPAGSANYDRAVQYASDQLRQWGYGPTLQTFPVQTYDDRGSSLAANAASTAEPLHVATDTLVYSLAGDVEAPLVAAGLGTAEDVAAVDLRGKIALLKRGTLRFSEKVANAAGAGALGVVIYNDDGSGRVQGSLIKQEAVPAVTISGDDGQRLLGLLAAGPLQARLRVDASVEDRPTSNVVAELPGSRGDNASIVIGAHLDSVPAGPGANDNGSGSAVVLELAHTLAQIAPSQRPLTLRFVLFGGEELGLFGSRYYVNSLVADDRRATVAMINLDMVGVGNEWLFGGNDDLVQRALGASSDLGLRALPFRGPLSSASDHASFASAGVPAVFVYRSDDPNYHTANDRAEFVDADALGQAGTMVLRVVDELAISN